MQSNYISVQGYRLHYLEAGHGPTVLLIHGFGGSAEGWRKTGEVLAGAGYHALAFDCLGFGKSDKPGDAPYSLEMFAQHFAEALGLLGIDQATIIGHSMGGKYALATALLYPSLVSGLVLVNSDGFAEPAAMSSVGKLPPVCATVLWLSGQPMIVRGMLSAAFHQPESFITEELFTHARDAFLGPENRRALTALSQRYDQVDLQLSGMRARLSELRVPTLLAWAEDDRIFPLRYGHIAAGEIPNAHLVVFPRCGHYLQIEAARRFYGLLLGFLAGIDVRSGQK